MMIPFEQTTVKETELVQAVDEVRLLREELAFLKEQYNRAFEKFLEVYEPLISRKNSKAQELTEAESRLRQLAEDAYRQTNDKNPVAGVKIRLVTKLNYDPQDALNWAIEHKLALALDTKAFEKIAKTSPMDFVLVESVPQATIARDLGAVYQKGEVKNSQDEPQ